MHFDNFVCEILFPTVINVVLFFRFCVTPYVSGVELGKVSTIDVGKRVGNLECFYQVRC